VFVVESIAKHLKNERPYIENEVGNSTNWHPKWLGILEQKNAPYKTGDA
jgi:hypothetical protein